MSNQWYVYKNQQQKGPFTWEQLWQQASSGVIGPADQIWTEGMAGWTRGDQVAGLFPKPAAHPLPPRPSSPRAVPPVVPPGSFGPTAPTFQSGASGPFPAAQTKKQGRGGLIALIVVLLVVLLGGGIFAYKYLLNDGISGLSLTKPDTGTSGLQSDTGNLIGSWRGVDDYGDEGYLKFNTDGTMHIASPWDGSWTTVNYRLEKENDIYYLEFDDYLSEEWERVSEIEFKGKDKLLITELYDGQIVEVTRISDQEFQELIDQLEYFEW